MCDRSGVSSWEALLWRKLWINDQQNQQRHRDQAKYGNASQQHILARQNILRPSLVFGHDPRSPLEWLRSMHPPVVASPHQTAELREQCPASALPILVPQLILGAKCTYTEQSTYTIVGLGCRPVNKTLHPPNWFLMSAMRDGSKEIYVRSRVCSHRRTDAQDVGSRRTFTPGVPGSDSACFFC